MNRPTFSLAVTAFNELTPERHDGKNLERCLSAAVQHPGISEIVVVDDGSERPIGWPDSVISFYHNEKNLGVFLNKLESVARCTGDWVICCDSDNFKDAIHISKALSLPLDPNRFYCPSFAKPVFDYREHIGWYDLKTIHHINEGSNFRRLMARCLLNTGNEMVHRETFMEVFGKYRGTDYWREWLARYPKFCAFIRDNTPEYNKQITDANDSFIYNMAWLLAGKSLEVVEGLEYDHTVGSGNASNYNRSPVEKGDYGNLLWADLMETSIEEAKKR